MTLNYFLPEEKTDTDDLGVSEDEDEEECFITFTTSESRCDALFDRGLDMVVRGDPSTALLTFLETLTALQECQYTNKLLPTLYQVAEVYKVLGEVDKFKEISDTLSTMQESLNEAMKEKKGRGRRTSQQGDCGSLFLQKADTLESLARDSKEKGNVACALQLAESAFRIQQYTLGPQHPVTVRSLTNLVSYYAILGEVIHLPNDAEPIIFTSLIKSSCQQSSTEYTHALSSSSYSNTPTPPLEGFTPQNHCHCSSAAPLSESQEGWSIDTPSHLQGDTVTTTQDVLMCSDSGGDDKPQLECYTNKDSTVDCDSFPPHNESTDLTSVFTFLVIFSVTAFAAFSFF